MKSIQKVSALKHELGVIIQKNRASAWSVLTRRYHSSYIKIMYSVHILLQHILLYSSAHASSSKLIPFLLLHILRLLVRFLFLRLPCHSFKFSIFYSSSHSSCSSYVLGFSSFLILLLHSFFLLLLIFPFLILFHFLLFLLLLLHPFSLCTSNLYLLFHSVTQIFYAL